MTDASEIDLAAARAAAAEAKAIADALDTERRRPGGFVYIPAGAPEAVAEALRALAREKGREVLASRPSEAQRLANSLGLT